MPKECKYAVSIASLFDGGVLISTEGIVNGNCL